MSSDGNNQSEANAAAARRWYLEGWTGQLELAHAIFAPELAINGLVVGPTGPQRNCANRLVGFPDLTVVVEEQVIADDKVVTRVLWRATHTGPYSGVAPTGRPVAVRDISIWRFVDGKSVENWTVLDQFGLLQQIGAIPATISGFEVDATLGEPPNGQTGWKRL
jgi:predicted ester cyclase